MYMFRKKTALVVGCLLLSLEALGQQPPLKAVFKLSSQLEQAVESSVLSAQLRHRARVAYRQARVVQQRYNALPSVFVGPSIQFETMDANLSSIPSATVSPQEVYPFAPFLTLNTLPAYFLAKHNFELRKWLPKIYANQQEILRKEKEFKASQVKILHPPSYDMTWLANQISSRTQYLLLGEQHGASQVQYKIADLLHALRKQQPKREIFLLTEFVEEGQSWHEVLKYPELKSYAAVWYAAEGAEIPVIGLETPLVRQEIALATLENPGNNASVLNVRSVWSSLEGVRLRNAKWLKSIRALRAQHPQALFVVYAGFSHVDYISPYSLGTALGGPETYVAIVTPDVYLDNGRPMLGGHLFDTYTNGAFYERVLQFKKTALRHLAGFDVRIWVPWTGE